MVYIIAFIVCLLFSHWAERTISSNKIVGILLSVVTILVLALLAGMRDDTVGTDTINYKWFFESACECNSFKEFLLSSQSVEVGYLFYTYVVSRITSELWIYLSLFHMLIIVPVFCVGMSNRGALSLPLVMFVFLFLFYNESLNITRQYVSISMGLVVLDSIIRRKYLKSILFMVLATAFHTSSILMFLYYLIYYMTQKFPFHGHEARYFFYMLVVIVLASIISTGTLDNLYFLSDRLGGYADSNVGRVSNSTFLLYALTSYIFFRKTRYLNDTRITMFLVISLFAMFFLMFSNYSSTFYRLALPFAFPMVYSFPYMYMFQKTSKSKEIRITNVQLIFYCVFFVFYWFFVIVLRGSYATYPYSSAFLGL